MFETLSDRFEGIFGRLRGKGKLSDADENSISVVGEFPAFVDFYTPVTDKESRLVTVIISKVVGGFRINAEPAWGRTTALHFEYLGDHFFGLSEPLQPDNQLSPDLTGSSIAVDDARLAPPIKQFIDVVSQPGWVFAFDPEADPDVLSEKATAARTSASGPAAPAPTPCAAPWSRT